MLRAVATLFLILSSSLSIAQIPPPVIGKAYIVADVSSGQILASEKADERFEPASLTTIMTAYLVFQALRDKKLALDRVVPVSEKAWRASGSRMFIDPKNPVSVDQLIRGMIVQSGNDASVALAEAVAGSEEVFVQLMNREAARMAEIVKRIGRITKYETKQYVGNARIIDLAAAAPGDSQERGPSQS